MEKLFLSREKYRLELHWYNTNYNEGICLFDNAYFSGPVLNLAEKIEANNSIQLDFFKQYFVLVTNVYIGTLSWDDVVYVEDKVYLMNCRLTHNSELHKAPKLEKNDILIIDCYLHDRETHMFYPSYLTYVVNTDKQLYNFEG